MSGNERKDQALPPTPPRQEANPLSDHAENILALKRLIQRVEAATATPDPSSPLNLEAHTGLFPHYGDDTKTIRATFQTPEELHRYDIHLATSFGTEGIIAIKHVSNSSGGSMQWQDGKTAITEFAEVLDRHDVPQL